MFFTFKSKSDTMNLKKLVVEFIGTFFLVLCFNICVLKGMGDFTSLAVGSLLIGLIFAGGHISGAHYNPAVTIAVFLRGKCSVSEVPSYIFAQILGAAIASLLASGFLLGTSGQGMDLSVSVAQALLSEFLGTFALCWVVLHVATTKDNIGNSFYGLAIGLVVIGAMMAFDKISGAAFNPAIALSFGVSNISGFNNLWIYVIAELFAAIAAAYTFLFVNGQD